MPTFFIPGELLQSVTVSGMGAPSTGYFKAKIQSVERHPSRPTSRRVNLVFETGFKTMDWLNSPCDEQGNFLPGMTESQIRGMVAHFKGLLFSAGYTEDQMGDGAHDDWLVGSTVFLEWHSKEDLGAQYGRIIRYFPEDRFVALTEAGTTPAIAQKQQAAAPVQTPAAPAAAPLPPTASVTTRRVVTPAPAAPAPAAPAPSAVPSNGRRLPPKPTARGVVR